MYLKVIHKGLDSLYLSHKGEIISDYLADLETKKLLAQSDDIREQCETTLQIGEHHFEVSGKGFKPYKYSIADNWFNIKIAGNAKRNIPDFYTQISSELLNCQGLDNSLISLRSIINNLTKNIESETVSRADLFVDIVTDMDLEHIVKKSWITRAIKKNQYSEHDNFTGWSIGQGGDISVRIYNKSIEIEKRNKDFFKVIWRKNDWNENETVWRIEFQLRRNFLKQMTIQTVDDFMLMINDVWRYCTEDWLRLGVIDGTLNRSRWSTHPFWENIQNIRFEDGNFTGSTRFVDKSRVPPDRILFTNGFGYIISYGAKYNIKNFDLLVRSYMVCALKYFHAIVKHNDKYEDEIDYINKKIALKRKVFNLPNKENDEDS